MRRVLIAISMLIFAGCQPDTATRQPDGHQQAEKPVEIKKVLRVKVAADGGITADGQPITLEQLSAKLVELKEAGGGVWYYRENPASEPHPNAMTVIQKVTENELPVKLSATPDFSDSVDDQGTSHPSNK